MSNEVLIKGFFTLIFSGMLAWVVFDRAPEYSMDSNRQRYMPYISGLLLPMCVLTILICAFVFYDAETAFQMTLAFCFGVFLHICLYYLLLMPALPFLRRHISARACAMLWMIPNYLYLTQMSYMQLPEPYWVIEVPSTLVRVALVVWLVGFLAVLGWKIVSHLAFRSRILRGASPVTDPAVLEIWRQEMEDARFRKPKFKLVTSPNIQTPLSVGLFRRSIRVVLPERKYAPSELKLIFRHELIHIGHEDTWNKFFLVFCSAMCWFNPLMWMAMRKSSEDLELHCDETVLHYSDEDTKRQYANLLLRTAGDEQGFTTCLSASANALRYRLKNVIDARKKHSGVLVVGLVFFLLCMTCGYVALAYGAETGAELLYQSYSTDQYVLRSIRGDDFICTNEAGLHQYLSALRMERIVGNYSFDKEETPLILIFDTPKGTLGVTLRDKYLKLVPLYGKISAQHYYLPDGIDWAALNEFILEYPVLHIHVIGTGTQTGRSITASLSRITHVDGNSTEVLYEMDPHETPNGMFGYPAHQASFSFSLPLTGDCVVEVIPLDGGSSQTITMNRETMTLLLPEESTRYIVHGEFQGKNGNQYELEYQFELGDV